MKITLPNITPGPWDVQEGKTLLHIETANNGDGSPAGQPVCSIPKKCASDAQAIAATHQTLEALAAVVSAAGNHGSLYIACDKARAALLAAGAKIED